MIILTKDNEVLDTEEMVEDVKIAILFEEDKGVLRQEAADKLMKMEYADYAKGRLDRVMKVLSDWLKV